ncbi:MAG TPA: 6-bladed beta-propeller [Candidatus Parabacteroides intestinipullorum]|uniref:6-bladed beta-propeller n=1 Tax=Candidatus Parabacteroides intestinipullorum TaxID=2838723 RepID=A0A9D1X8R2_9BACT|nr:6-bladed beta-propeller [Candidatus Parabacteroides intestinipullorum]
MDWKYLLLFPLLFFGCQTEKEAQDPLEVRIDYQNAKVKPFEDLLRERPIQEEYVLLRSKSSETDFSKPKKILVQNEKIFILDSARPTKLVVFSREGEGLAQVGTRGEGPQEYLSIADFDVADDGKIYFIDGQSDKLFCFNEDFSFAYTKELPFEADILKAVSDGFLFGLSSWNTGECEGAKIIRTDGELNVQERFLEYDEYTDPAFWISGYTFIRTRDGIVYNQTIDNHIYQFDPDGNYKGSVNMDFGS